MKALRWLVHPFVLALSAIVATIYAYLAWRLAAGPIGLVTLAAPLVAIWLVPVRYWIAECEAASGLDEALHIVSYLSMGWLNFAVLFSLARDAAQLAAAALGATALHDGLRDFGAPIVLLASVAALGLGMLAALRGPHVRHVDIPIEGLHRDLDGLRIVQISDLHIGPTVGRAYVRRVVRMTNALAGDLVALTGDLVDGPVERLARAVAPLAELQPAQRLFFAMGNHDYYSGPGPWIGRFRELGLQVLLNEAVVVRRGEATLVVGGVVDPAAAQYDGGQVPRPERAMAPEAGSAFRLLLAHNPKLAPAAAQAGFDLQLSGHTHAGQFFPWTLAVRWVHTPHVAGLSRCGRMWVYVSAGTGTWGPPVRFGSEPELTVVRLLAVPGAAHGRIRPSREP